MILAAITFNTLPALGWPTWQHVYYFEFGGTLDHETARTLATDVVYFERTLQLDVVNRSLVVFVQAEGDLTPGEIQGYPVSVSGQDWPGQRTATEIAPWTHCLRVVRSRYPGRAVHNYFRGCFNRSDLLTGEGNHIEVADRSAFQTLVEEAVGAPSGLVWPNWVVNVSPGTWPVAGVQVASAPAAQGASRLNAQRRAMAKHMSAGVAALDMIIVEVHTWCLGMDNFKAAWMGLDMGDLYPVSLQSELSDLANHLATAATAAQSFLNDADSGTAGEQPPQARYLMTTEDYSSIVSNLAAKTAEAMATINSEIPHTFVGENYFYQYQIESMFAASEELHRLAAAVLAFDFLNSYMAGPDSATRGGYVPLHPEIDPT